MRWWLPLALVVVGGVAWTLWPKDSLPKDGVPGEGGPRDELPGAGPPTREPAESLREDLAAGIALFESGDRAGARAHFESLLRTDPGDAAAAIQLAAIATADRRFEDAEATLRKVLEIDAENAEAWTSLGTLLLLLEKGPEAAKCFETAIAADARYAPARFYYGQMLEGAGLLAKARPEYEWARRIDPETPYYGLVEARVLWKSYQPTLARTLLAQIDRGKTRPLTPEEDKLRREILEDLEIWPEGPPPDMLPPDPEDIVDEQPDGS